MTAKRQRDARRTKDRERPPLPESPYPKLGPSLVRGARAAADPAVLVTAFLSLLAMWGVFLGFGADASPRTLAVLLSLPPVHILFGDAALAIPRGASPAFSVAAVAALAVARAVTFGALALLLVQVLRTGRTSIVEVVRALPRIALMFVGLYLLQFGLMVAGFQLVAGLLGQLAFLAIAVGLYFLVLSPVILAAEGDTPVASVRRGVRAARLPGTRHLTLVMAYFLVLFYASLSAPFPLLGPATPSVAAWAYGLAITFVHVAVLGTLTYRWLAVREEVPPAAPRR